MFLDAGNKIPSDVMPDPLHPGAKGYPAGEQVKWAVGEATALIVGGKAMLTSRDLIA